MILTSHKHEELANFEHHTGRRQEFSNIHRKDKIHLIQPEKLPNSKPTENQQMNERRDD
jgi:hypothetical protein